METQKTSECFEIVDGMLQYIYTKVLFTLDNATYLGRCQDRIPSSSYDRIDLNSLTDVTPIPIEAYCPLVPADYIQVPDAPALLAHCYIKRPNLMSYGEGLDLCESVSREVKACEILRKYPHPNIAQYYGCQIEEGRVIGLYFAEYKQTLMDRLNPNNLNKTTFSTSNHQLTDDEVNRYLRGIKEGISHIHSLGLVHNDINPSNVMLTSEDVPMIIDFDSCLPEGAPLESGKVKRTYEWYDENVQVSTASNDFDAFLELERWMGRDLGREQEAGEN